MDVENEETIKKRTTHETNLDRWVDTIIKDFIGEEK